MKQDTERLLTSSNFDVFLSHNSKDKPAVLEIANKLKSKGLRVWYDDWCIKIGDDIYQKIEQGLQESKIFIFCVSDNSLESDWVSLEKNTAVFRDPSNKSRCFYPIIVSNFTTQLPQTLQRIKFGNYCKQPDTVIEDIVSLHKSFSYSPIININEPSISKKLILVVDDEEHTLRGFERIFREHYDIVTATTVDGALNALSGKIHTLNVAIVDQRLPRRNGWELLEYLKRHNSRAIRILSSAYSDFDSLVDAVNKAAVHSFIPKPWDVDHLKLMIGHAIRAHDEQIMMPSFVMEMSPPKSIPRSNDQSYSAKALLPKNTEASKDKDSCLERAFTSPVEANQENPALTSTHQINEISSAGLNALRARALNPIMTSIAEELDLFIISFEHESKLRWSYIFEMKIKRLIRDVIASKDYMKFYKPEIQINSQTQVIYGLKLLKKSLSKLLDKHGAKFREYHFSSKLAEKLLNLIGVIDLTSINQEAQ